MEGHQGDDDGKFANVSATLTLCWAFEYKQMCANTDLFLKELIPRRRGIPKVFDFESFLNDVPFIRMNRFEIALESWLEQHLCHVRLHTEQRDIHCSSGVSIHDHADLFLATVTRFLHHSHDPVD